MRRTTGLGPAAALLALLLALLLAGCAGDDRSPEDGPTTSVPSSEPIATPAPVAPTRPFAATLELAAAADPLGGADSSDALVLTNTGLGDDDYFLRPVPPTAGAVSPAEVSLSAGASVEVRVVPRIGSELTVTVISAALEAEVARLVIAGE